MPTIKDIAEQAGVSHGTVSNVLNKRGNVSAEKINLVEKVARELGYTINAQAKQLRQGNTKKICVVIPRNDIKKYNDLFSGLNNRLRESDYEVEVYFTYDQRYEEERLLERILAVKPVALVLVSTFVKNVGMFNNDFPIIMVERKILEMPQDTVYAGFDYYLAGKMIASECLKDGHRNIALFCEGRQYSNNQEFMKGIEDVLLDSSCQMTHFQANSLLNLSGAFEIQNTKDEFDAVITDNMERAEIIQSVNHFDQGDWYPTIYTMTSKRAFLNESIKRYELNYKLCGQKIADFILKKELDEQTLLIKNDGFSANTLYTIPHNPLVINFLTLVSPTTQAIKYLLPDFTAKTGITVNLIEVSYDQLYQSMGAIVNGNSAYDLVRMDMVWMSKFASSVYRPMDIFQAPYKEIIEGFSDVFKDEYFLVDGKNYALPLDPSVQILYYRKDLFNDALLKREFYEQYKRQLEVPKTFKEYNEIASFFTRKINPHSPTKYGTALTYGSTPVAACDFLPRFKEYGETIFDANHSIKVETKTMKKALNEYVESLNYTDQNAHLWWNEVIGLFAQGDIAMDIVFSNHAPAMVLNHNSTVTGKVGFAAVPGHKPLLGGGVIGITKESHKVNECELFFKWVYSEKIVSMITLLGGYINHKTLINNQDILEIYPWIEGMEKAFKIGERSCKQKDNFDENVFEEILGEAVRSVILKLQSVDEALQHAQNKFDQLLK